MPANRTDLPSQSIRCPSIELEIESDAEHACWLKFTGMSNGLGRPPPKTLICDSAASPGMPFLATYAARCAAEARITSVSLSRAQIASKSPKWVSAWAVDWLAESLTHRLTHTGVVHGWVIWGFV
jgi:hypothetical protein